MANTTEEIVSLMKQAEKRRRERAEEYLALLDKKITARMEQFEAAVADGENVERAKLARDGLALWDTIDMLKNFGIEVGPLEERAGELRHQAMTWDVLHGETTGLRGRLPVERIELYLDRMAVAAVVGFRMKWADKDERARGRVGTWVASHIPKEIGDVLSKRPPLTGRQVLRWYDDPKVKGAAPYQRAWQLLEHFCGNDLISCDDACERILGALYSI